MELKQAIEVLKMNRPLIGRIGDEVMEAIDTVIAEVEKPKYMADDMEAFAEWCADSLYEYIGNRWKSCDLNRIATTTQLRELWEKERRAK